jgi:ketosteroid isomerase-like protein
VVVAVAMMVAPLTVASASNDGDPLATKATQAIDRFIKLWNENKLDELVAGHYTDDSIMLPPNHEVIRGRAAILEFLKGARDAVGDFDALEAPYSVVASGDMVSLVGKYSFRSHQIRFSSHERYERQPDGSVRCLIDMFGYAMP